MAPFDLVAELGKPAAYTIYLLLGFGFGAVLEQSGFGDSRKLAGQFYFTEMTVLKVMFTGIITACALVFLFVSLGYLEFSRVWVQPTYVWPGIFGGLVMGVGFIIGGFCPGTSIVSLSTFKIDGLFFVVGVGTGILLFGETVHLFNDFYLSSSLGRYVLPDWMDLSTGVTILLIFAMAAFMFFGAEISERIIGKKDPEEQMKQKNIPIAVMVVLFGIAFAVTFMGDPDAMDKYAYKAKDYDKLLAEKKVQIHPAELAEASNDPAIYLKILDLRPETEYNLFHLQNSRQITMEQLEQKEFLNQILSTPNNTVYIVIGATEKQSVTAWKTLKGNGIINLYYLDGGMDSWLKQFPPDHHIAQEMNGKFVFRYAVGQKAANSFISKDILKAKKLVYPKVIKVKKKQVLSGGCG